MNAGGPLRRVTGLVAVLVPMVVELLLLELALLLFVR